MSARRDRIFIFFTLAAFAGAIGLFLQITWLLWQESVSAEEARVAALAKQLGEQAEQMIVEARDMLDRFNRSDYERCSEEHISAMHLAAIDRPHIRAIGYWRAAERVCGVGFIQTVELKPSRADRIYDSGVIAWWPSAQTEIGGVQLFLMRYGDHDMPWTRVCCCRRPGTRAARPGCGWKTCRWQAPAAAARFRARTRCPRA